MIHRLVLAAMIAATAVTGTLAQERPPVGEAGNALRAAILAVDIACAVDREAVACLMALEEATPLITDALATAGATGDRVRYRNGVVAYLAAASAEIRAAAAFALAGLFPDAEDTPLLLPLLMDAAPGVRRAAVAALLESSDPVARVLADRAGEETGISFNPQQPPYDPAAVAELLPPDAVYLEFERDDLASGTLFFVTDETPEQALARLQASGGQRYDARSFPSHLRLDAALAVLTRPEAYAGVAAIVLQPENDRGESRVAFVYRDVQLGKTGIALAFEPAGTLPEPVVVAEPEPREVVPNVPLPDLAGAAVEIPLFGDAAVFVPDPAATPEDNFAYLAVLTAEGAGAAAYLELFPAGAYRDEVETILATQLIVEVQDYRVAPGADIVVTLFNMPGDANDRLTIAPLDAPDGELPSPFFTGGITDGTVTIQAPTRSGQREIRVYFGGSDEVQRRVRIIVDPSVTAEAPLGGALTVGVIGENAGGGANATLTVAQPVYAGQRVNVSFGGFAGTEREWVTIVPAGAADTAYAGYVYTTGQAGTATLNPIMAPGQYEIRAIADRPTQRVIARLAIEVALVTENLPGVTFELAAPATPGQPIAVRFAGLPDIAGNWIAIVRAGTPDNVTGTYAYARTTAGEVTLTGQTAGRYELRLIVEQPRRVIIARLAIEVGGNGGAGPVPPAPAPAPTPMPTPAPTPTPPPVPVGNATLTVDGPVYAGPRITISFAGFTGTDREWVTIVPPETPEFGYAGYVYTTGQAGTVTYNPILVPGQYEIRAIADRPTQRVIARLPIEIVAIAGELPGVTLELAAPATAGQPIVVRFSGVPDIQSNWISIVPEGTVETAFGVYVSARGSSGEVTLTGQRAGRYELRFFVETPRRVIIARLAVTIE